jgi:transposase
MEEGGQGESIVTTSTLAARNGASPARTASPPPNPEVSDRARRRTLTAAYKLRIVCEADGCAHGELGALLRREGLYSTQLATWRKQRQDGTLSALGPHRRGRPPTVSAEAAALAAVRAENERLAQQLAAAEAIIDIQKKVCSLLGLTQPSATTGRPS